MDQIESLFILALLLTAVMWFLAGKQSGRRAERRKAARLTSFAARFFGALQEADEHEWHRLSVIRRDGKYIALFYYDEKRVDTAMGDLR